MFHLVALLRTQAWVSDSLSALKDCSRERREKSVTPTGHLQQKPRSQNIKRLLLIKEN